MKKSVIYKKRLGIFVFKAPQNLEQLRFVDPMITRIIKMIREYQAL